MSQAARRAGRSRRLPARRRRHDRPAALAPRGLAASSRPRRWRDRPAALTEYGEATQRNRSAGRLRLGADAGRRHAPPLGRRHARTAIPRPSARPWRSRATAEAARPRLDLGLRPPALPLRGPARERLHEAWTTLAALAPVVPRVELAALVMCSSFRNPGLMAKMAATLDAASGGRVLLGLGSGWHDPEYEAFGYPTDHRVGRFAEDLEVDGAAVAGRTGHLRRAVAPVRRRGPAPATRPSRADPRRGSPRADART